jgi:hypothetical protein
MISITGWRVVGIAWMASLNQAQDQDEAPQSVGRVPSRLADHESELDRSFYPFDRYSCARSAANHLVEDSLKLQQSLMPEDRRRNIRSFDAPRPDLFSVDEGPKEWRFPSLCFCRRAPAKTSISAISMLSVSSRIALRSMAEMVDKAATLRVSHLERFGPVYLLETAVLVHRGFEALETWCQPSKKRCDVQVSMQPSRLRFSTASCPITLLYEYDEATVGSSSTGRRRTSRNK